MTIKAKLNHAALAFAAAVAFSAPASAAYIAIDDSDVNNITITAGDFERGFSVNGNLLTSGLGNSGSITLADGGHSISGSWIDLGQSGGLRVDLLFAFLADPTGATSGVEFGASTDGSMGTLGGTFGGLIGSPYFSTALPTFDQDDPTTRFGSLPFLSVSFTPEAAARVPEPGTLALLGIAGLAALRRRRA